MVIHKIQAASFNKFKVISLIKDVIEVDTEAKVDEESFKQLEVKPFEDISDEDKNDMNVDVIGYQLFK